MLELSDGLRSALELSRVPDHSTLWWFARHKLKPERLQAALEVAVRRFEHSLRRPLAETVPMRVLRQKDTMTTSHGTNAQREWWH